MIYWTIEDYFVYLPLDINCLTEQNGPCSLNYLSLGKNKIQELITLITSEGIPIVIDFEGISNIEQRVFDEVESLEPKRAVLFCNLEALAAKRLHDDNVPTHPISHSAESNHDSQMFWIGSRSDDSLLEKVCTLGGNYYPTYIRHQTQALVEWNKPLISTGVFAEKYYDVMKLCADKDNFRVISVGLTKAILKQKDLNFDFVISASHTGAFLAVPIASLLGKRLRCWTDFGPAFLPKRGIEWNEGRGKKCLLVADVVCMGTEVRAAQAFLAALGCTLEACVSVASYLPPDDIISISLLNKNDLDSLGYKLSIK